MSTPSNTHVNFFDTCRKATSESVGIPPLYARFCEEGWRWRDCPRCAQASPGWGKQQDQPYAAAGAAATPARSTQKSTLFLVVRPGVAPPAGAGIGWSCWRRWRDGPRCARASPGWGKQQDQPYAAAGAAATPARSTQKSTLFLVARPGVAPPAGAGIGWSCWRRWRDGPRCARASLEMGELKRSAKAAAGAACLSWQRRFGNQAFLALSQDRHPFGGPSLTCWRRWRDSNPRYPREYTAFRVRPDRPLWHISGAKIVVRAFPEQGKICPVAAGESRA